MNGLSDMKICANCGQMKTKDEFEPRQYMPDGLWHKCKECRHPSYTPEEAVAAKAKIRAYDPEYLDRVDSNRVKASEWYQKNKENLREYRERPDRKEASSAYTKRYRREKAHILDSHQEVAKAVRKGILKRPLLCSRCSKSGTVHGHHHDYTKPLDVTWLCPACHHGEHRRIRDSISTFE